MISMGWSFIIISAASAAAGLALGRIVGRQARVFILIGGIEAAVLGGALAWLPAYGVEPPLGPGMGQVLELGLLTIAAVLLAFWLGSTWSGP